MTTLRVTSIVLVLVLGACSSCGSGTTRSASGGSQELEPYVVDQFVCVDAATTVDLGRGSQQPETGAPSGCKTWPTADDVMPLVRERSMCGPCGFVLDREATARERADHPTACCYLVSSPPPPPPPPT